MRVRHRQRRTAPPARRIGHIATAAGRHGGLQSTPEERSRRTYGSNVAVSHGAWHAVRFCLSSLSLSLYLSFSPLLALPACHMTACVDAFYRSAQASLSCCYLDCIHRDVSLDFSCRCDMLQVCRGVGTERHLCPGSRTHLISPVSLSLSFFFSVKLHHSISRAGDECSVVPSTTSRYNVWSITRQDYIDLFWREVRQMNLSELQTPAYEIGVGTGTAPGHIPATKYFHEWMCSFVKRNTLLPSPQSRCKEDNRNGHLGGGRHLREGERGAVGNVFRGAVPRRRRIRRTGH